MRSSYDVIVIGGGHAGTEAAWAAASVLSQSGNAADEVGLVALITMDPSRIGQMSCNPAIGGLGKGQMVREIDALGGLMGLAIDATGIMFKMLNMSRGAAVQGPRAQADKYAYAAEVQRLISTRANIDVISGTIDDIIVENGRVVGVVVPAAAAVVQADCHAIEWNISNAGKARPIYSRAEQPPAEPGANGILLRTNAVVLTTGTFMRGLMHTGAEKTPGGRVNENAAVGISATLRKLGFELGRLKTGTPPRLAAESIDWAGLEIQTGDDPPTPFSDLTCVGNSNVNRTADGPDRFCNVRSADQFPVLRQSKCYLTRTTAEVHEIIRQNLDRAPMYSGQIEAECGPRYCPSIEDKVVRFAERDSHHVFLEPESLHTNEIYCNGISTSLPMDVQEKMVHLMPGCERAEILRWGYAVEYDMVWPHQIDATCMTKLIHGLFFAGQINCTTGYEEAGGQGVIAGLNAARLTRSEDPIRLGRDQAYIGVMLDDLVTKTPREPYRMFTSRAEYRLLLRGDNTDARLTPLGRELGLVDDARWDVWEHRKAQLDALNAMFDTLLIDGRTLRHYAKRQEATIDRLMSSVPGEIDRALVQRVMNDSKYDGYIGRQRAEIRRQSDADRKRIPDWLVESDIIGLRKEAMDVLRKFKPTTLGQAARLSGINPADVTLLAVSIDRGWRMRAVESSA